MNDFLYNLASRATTAECDIRPRLSSLFEPIASVAMHGLAGDGLEDSPDVSSDLPSRDPFPGTLSSRIEKVDARPPQDEQDDSHSNIGKLLPARDRQRSLHHPPEVPGTIGDRHPDLSRGQLSSVPEQGILRPTLRHAVEDNEHSIEASRYADLNSKLIPKTSFKDSRDFDDDSIQTIKAGESVVRTQPDSLLIASPVRRVPKTSDINPQSAVETGAYSKPTSLSTKHPPSRLSLPRPRMTYEPPVPENVINVTIGRIEVRATSAPAPKSRRDDQTHSVMSLDDYLRQRAGTNRGGGV